MSWVEELDPEDEVVVDVIFPKEYIDYNMSTIKRYSSGISHLCKGAVLLGEEDTEFLVYGMTILQIITLEEALLEFGIKLTHEVGMLPDGTRWAYFYADLSELKELMENGMLDNGSA